MLYINDLINEQTKSKKLNFLVNRFLDYIDNKTQYYLKHIEFPDHLKKIFDDSLNDNENRFQIILKGYKILMDLVTKVRKEPFVEFIDDQEFLKTFKKRKRENE